MQLKLTSNRVEVSPLLRDLIERRLKSVVNRLQGSVMSATVSLNDVNGPRGGVCKQCRVIINARGVPPVVVTDVDERVHVSASRAIERAGFALQRRVKEMRGRKTKVRKLDWLTAETDETNEPIARQNAE